MREGEIANSVPKLYRALPAVIGAISVWISIYQSLVILRFLFESYRTGLFWKLPLNSCVKFSQSVHI